MKQCSLLIVDRSDSESPFKKALERRGFRVTQSNEWPADDVVRDSEVVIIVLRHLETICMLAGSDGVS